ncbi:unnamed protein product [Microthlaspi erraticum]|uniref:Uncharacterized protein n=1 Tax=Microthlaspi erraticum TaxID=1685480 RepID=A0A6D2JMV9_9BRAS|nr:unnamed protein product [Microthlaspi erraticum]
MFLFDWGTVEAGLQARGVWRLGNPPCIEYGLASLRLWSRGSSSWERADLGSDLFLVWDGLFGEHRHFVALLGTSVPRTLEVMSDWFVDDEGSWFSTGQVWTAESGSSSSEPSSNSEHWIVVTDLEQQTLRS